MKRAACYLLSIAAGSAAAGLMVLACGARTGLDAPEQRGDAAGREDDGAARHRDASADHATDSFVARVDATLTDTGHADTGKDVTVADAGKDATLGDTGLIDSSMHVGLDDAFPADVIGPVDVHVALDSALSCPEAGLPNAYLFDNAGALYTFDPATLATHLLGTPTCAGAAGPWTLSVSRENTAYVVYMDPWSIYAVDLTSLVCTPTPFVAGQLGLQGFFSIAVSRSAGAETLFYYGEPGSIDAGVDDAGIDQEMYPGTAPIVAQSDLSSFVLTEVGPVVPVPPADSFPFDMQGDPLGNLFGLSNDGLLVEMSAATGAAIGQADTSFPGDDDWAVMSYENQIYLFGALISDGGAPGTRVARYDIGTQTLTMLGTIGITVLGASAVPCLQGGNVTPLK